MGKRKPFVLGVAWTLLLLGFLIIPVTAGWKWNCQNCSSGATTCFGQGGCDGQVQECFDCIHKCGNVVGGEIVYGEMVLECEPLMI